VKVYDFDMGVIDGSLLATKDISQLGNYAAIEDVGRATKCMGEERQTERGFYDIPGTDPKFDS
jgi:hypothetical protein